MLQYFFFALDINSVLSNVVLVRCVSTSVIVITFYFLSMPGMPHSIYCITEGLLQDALYYYLPSISLDDITWKVFQKSLYILKTLAPLKSTPFAFAGLRYQTRNFIP